MLLISIVGIPFACRTAGRWAFGTQAIIVDHVGAEEAISKSSEIVSGHGWQVFGILTGTVLLFAAPDTFLSLFFAGAPETLLAIFIRAILAPVVASFLLLFYLRLDAYKKGIASISALHPPRTRKPASF